jgi:hypothetical protein
MRAILIDPETKTFTEIDFKGGREEIEHLLGTISWCSGLYRWLRGSSGEDFETIMVDACGMETRPEQRFWFQVDADREENETTSPPIAGKGLVVGCDAQGKDADARTSLDELRRRITFTQRKFRGICQQPSKGMRGPLLAPIIDGANEG